MKVFGTSLVTLLSALKAIGLVHGERADLIAAWSFLKRFVWTIDFGTRKYRFAAPRVER
jgi:hypothetical protein